MIAQMLVRVSGRVQGVGFRSLVSRSALKHNIKGYVRNLADGRVEICAQGTTKEIQEFFADIRKNPGRASIERFDEQKTEFGKLYSSFEVHTESD